MDKEENTDRIEGVWWLPEEPKERITGSLITDRNGAKLELTFEGASKSRFSNPHEKKYGVIHGISTDRKEFTLLECYVVEHLNFFSRSALQSQSQSILVNFILEGSLVPLDRIGEAFSALSLTWPSLTRWFLKSGVVITTDPGDPRNFTITNSQLDPISFSYSDEINIRFDFGVDKLPMGGPLSKSIDFREIVWVTLETDKPQGILYFLARLEELVHFFSICLSNYVYPERFTLSEATNISDDDTKPINIKLTLFSTLRAEPERFPSPGDAFVRFESIEDRFSEVLRKWAKVSKKIRPVRILYFSSSYGRNHQYLEAAFLSLAQAAEVFHRRIHGGNYLDREQYEDVILPALQDAIERSVPNEIKAIYNNRLAYFNEYSLSKRLKSMGEKYEELLKKFVPNWKKRIREVVEKRNYFTHFSDENVDTESHISNLTPCCNFLSLILELEFLAACDLDRKEISNWASECQPLLWKFMT